MRGDAKAWQEEYSTSWNVSSFLSKGAALLPFLHDVLDALTGC